MHKQTDRSKKISVQEKHTGNSSKFLALAEIVHDSNSEIVHDSTSESVQQDAIAGQTHLFYTKPIHRARKYDLF